MKNRLPISLPVSFWLGLLLALIASCLMCSDAFAATVPASATKLNINTGNRDAIIKADGLYYYTESTDTYQKVAALNPAGYVLSGSTTNTITVEPGVQTTLYLDNATMYSTRLYQRMGDTNTNNIVSTHPSCINVTGADVKIYVNGTNSVTVNSHPDSSGSCTGGFGCAIEKNGMDGTLTFATIDGNNSSGSLSVTAMNAHEGALGSSITACGRGQGGFANLTIESGVYTVKAGAHTPGIGANCDAYQTSYDTGLPYGKQYTKNIVIKKAQVTAYGGNDCAGIGGGYGVPLDGLTISNGAKVIAYGGLNSPGIGSGGVDSGPNPPAVDALNVSNISIIGGNTEVIAMGDQGSSGEKTPAIGCGSDKLNDSNRRKDANGNGIYYERVLTNVTATALCYGEGSENAAGEEAAWYGNIQCGSDASHIEFSASNFTTPYAFADYLQSRAASGNPVSYVHIYITEAPVLNLQKDADLTGWSGENATAAGNIDRSGAKYSVYTNSACTTPYQLSGANLVLQTDSAGKAITPLPPGTYYIKETAAPDHFKLSNTVYTVTMVNGTNQTLTVSDAPDPIHVYYKDRSASTTLKDELIPFGGTSTHPADPIWLGRTFLGYASSQDRGEAGNVDYPKGQPIRNVKPSGNSLTVWSSWRINTYTIAFDSNRPANASGTMVGTMGAITGVKYDSDQALTLNAFSLTGWSFTGWNTKADGSGTSYSNGQSVKNLTSVDGATVTLYAQWRPHTYKIYLEGNGNTNDVETPVVTMTYDTPKNLAENPYEVTWRITYVGDGTMPTPNPQTVALPFLGWGAEATDSTASYDDMERVNNLTSEDGGEVYLYAIWDPSAAEITMPPSTLAGSELQGWDDGSGSLYEEGDTYNLMEEGDGQERTFTAVYDFVTYNITFDANGGDPVDSMSYTAATLPLTLPNATKKDYVFTGWTGDNGTTPTINLVLPAGSVGDKHYVANWKKDGSIELTKYGAVTKTEHKGVTKETDNDFSENNIAYPGESTITYYVTLTNTGNVDLYEIEIDDDILGGAGYDFKDWDGTLKAHESITLYAANPQVVTQSEINIGSKSNAVKVNSKMKDSGEALEELSADITTTFYKKDELKLVKEVAALHPHQGQTSSSNSEFSKEDSPKAGESTIDYAFTVENTGNTTLTGVRLADAMIDASASTSLSLHGDLTNGSITLNYGDSFDADASGYVLTQDDVNAAEVENTATVTGTSQATGASNITASDSANVTIAAAPSISLAKEVSELTLDGHTSLGRTYGFRDGDDVRAGVATVAWKLTLTNTGNVPLTGMAISDAKASSGGASISGENAPDTLMPGQSCVYLVGRYALSVDDINDGIVENQATAEAIAPNGEKISATSNVATTSISQSSELVLEMTVNKTTVTGADIQSTKNLTWELTLTNAGNTTFSNISVVSSFFARQGVSVNFDWANSTDPATPSNELSGGEVVKATVTAPVGVLIWKDKGDGSEVATLVNEAYVTANTPGVAGKISTDIAKTTTTFISKPSISTTITPSPSHVSDGDYTGNPVNYTIIVTNTGDVELKDVDYTTTDLGYITIDWGSSSNASTGDGVLAPGERVTATATRFATRDEVNAGHMDATATFKGTTNQGMTVTSKADARTTFAAMPAISAGKFVDDRDYESLSGNVTVGTKIPYRIEVENTGNVTLTNVTVEDMLAGATSPDYGEWDRSLAPGEKRIVKLYYTTRLSDLANGSVVNRASVTGYAPDGNRATATATAAEVPLTISPQLTATAGEPVAVGPDSAYAGARITEVYTVENTGDSTVTGIDMSGWFADNSVVTFKWPSANRTLKPGEKVTVKVVYPLTPEDLDRRYAESNNIFTGGDLLGRPVSCNLERKVPIEILAGGISLKAIDYNAILTNATVGKKARFVFEVTNNWNGTVSGVALMPADKRFTVIGKPVKLAAGKSAELTVETTLTQDDINRGHIEFKMRASGSTVNGNTVTRTALTPHRKQVKQNNAIKLELTAPAEIVNVLAGRTVEYYYSIQNTGNTTLSALDLANSVQGLVNLRFDGTDQLESLAPGRKILASAVYPVTQEDIDRGYVENTGKVSGSSPARKNVEDIQLVKTYLRPAEYATEYPDQPENPAGLRLRLDVADGVFVWVDDSGQRIRTASGSMVTLPDGSQLAQVDDGDSPAHPITKTTASSRTQESQQTPSTGDVLPVSALLAFILALSAGTIAVIRRRSA